MSRVSECIYPQVLLLASRYDLACDYIIAQLLRQDVKYLRLNSEDLSESTINLDPVRRRLDVKVDGRDYVVIPSELKSVLFRRPVFLRDYGDTNRTPDARFSRMQWAAFIRNLMLFQEARWINDPTATYRAEHKGLQLWTASCHGFPIPETRVTNNPRPGLLGNGVNDVAVKGLDTVLSRARGKEKFGFTSFDSLSNLNAEDWQSAPGTIQVHLNNKLDIRVTVVEHKAFAASITVHDRPVIGDWRVEKERAEFSEYGLPEDIARRCCDVVESLGLRFAGIDLALQDSEFYFLEINPTGEWAWLVDGAGLPIDEAIADALVRQL